MTDYEQMEPYKVMRELLTQGDHLVYNIIDTGDNDFVLQVALPGWEPHEVGLEEDEGVLILRCLTNADVCSEDDYLHRGFEKKSFRRQFKLQENIKVTSAGLRNGLLTVCLHRHMPEPAGPKAITIDF